MNDISELNKTLFKKYPNCSNYNDIYDYYFGKSRQTKESIKRDEECKKYVEKLKEKERIKSGIKLYKQEQTDDTSNDIDNYKSILDNKIKEYEYMISNYTLLFNNFNIWNRIEKEYSKK